MKKLSLILVSFLFCHILLSQNNPSTIDDVITSNPKNIVTDLYNVTYSEELQQPLNVTYYVQCPNGNASRSGLDFRMYWGIFTSDNEDYKDNEWDKGHLAPAAAFNCTRDMIRETFLYINCALQHEGLNRGPWKELEGFERDLAKIFDEVYVEITCHFSKNSLVLPTGATVPDGFTKNITFDNRVECFYFPNKDVSGIDWSEFRITND